MRYELRQLYNNTGYERVETPSGESAMCGRVCTFTVLEGYFISGKYPNTGFYKAFKKTDDGLNEFLQYKFFNGAGEDVSKIVHEYMKERWFESE